VRFAITLVLLLTTAALFAQGRGGGGGGGGGDFGGGGVAVERSGYDLLIEELDLDRTNQIPAVTKLLQSAEAEASGLFQELIARRQELLNVETSHSPDPAPAAAYRATMTKLMALETRIFGEIYALLTPKQKQKAAKGFDRLEALFRTTLSAPAGGRGGGRGGAGRGASPQGGGR
jgi:Spy/CpxP family protein refolding chaperone